MRSFLYWFFAVVITLTAAFYQRLTGPTHPKRVEISINGEKTKLRLVRSLGLDEPSRVKLHIKDESVKATLYYKRYKSGDPYSASEFQYKVFPVNSFLMNKVFKITEERGLFADVPQQPAAGKLQYYIEITDRNGKALLLKEEPVVIRFKGGVPNFVLVPHIFIMFFAMLLSTLAGLLAIGGRPSHKKYGLWTFILLLLGGMILGPVVQKFAFGEFWTGIPFAWDLTDNKTLFAFLFWILAVVMNRKRNRPVYTIIASIVMLMVYSIPHSMYGSELNPETGKVIQGMIQLLTAGLPG